MLDSVKEHNAFSTSSSTVALSRSILLLRFGQRAGSVSFLFPAVPVLQCIGRICRVGWSDIWLAGPHMRVLGCAAPLCTIFLALGLILTAERIAIKVRGTIGRLGIGHTLLLLITCHRFAFFYLTLELPPTFARG